MNFRAKKLHSALRGWRSFSSCFRFFDFISIVLVQLDLMFFLFFCFPFSLSSL